MGSKHFYDCEPEAASAVVPSKVVGYRYPIGTGAYAAEYENVRKTTKIKITALKDANITCGSTTINAPEDEVLDLSPPVSCDCVSDGTGECLLNVKAHENVAPRSAGERLALLSLKFK